MDFPTARQASRDGYWIRRESWDAAKWIKIWRGLWFCWNADALRVVKATDFVAADFFGTDFTTMPAALAACPIDPDGTGSTGGGTYVPPGSSDGPGTGGGPTGGDSGSDTPTVTWPGFPPPAPPAPPGGGPVPPPPTPDPTACTIGTATLNLVPNCPDGLAVELEIDGFSSGGLYDVKIDCTGVKSFRGSITGGSGSAAHEFTGLTPRDGRQVTVTATLTGLGADNPCRGRRHVVTQTIAVFCAPGLAINFSGFTLPEWIPAPEGAGYIHYDGQDVSGGITLTWDGLRWTGSLFGTGSWGQYADMDTASDLLGTWTNYAVDVVVTGEIGAYHVSAALNDNEVPVFYGSGGTAPIPNDIGAGTAQLTPL